MPANTPAEQAVLEAAIKRELPAYLYWLLNVFQIPDTIKEGGRGGFKVIQNQEILEKINGTAPELELRELLERVYLADGFSNLSGKEIKQEVRAGWLKLGTSQDILTMLTTDSFSTHVVRSLLPSARTCGRYMSRLADKFPAEFRRIDGHGGVYKYEMRVSPERRE